MTKKKRLGTKAQINAEKEREKRIATAIFLASILLIVIISAYFGYTFLNQPQNQTVNQESSQPKAAIVDHLSLTFPNQTFIETATNILKQAGYQVDYYPGRQVTVEFYRNLLTHGYKIIILRVHSTTGGYPTVALFTSELYSKSKYIYEQLTDQLVRVAFHYTDIDRFFGILPSFIKSSMNGKFADALIIMMGCEGLNNTKMAEAFIEKGAKAYISWKGSVSASHTDQVTIHLLQHLISEDQTIRETVEHTMKEIGPDPAHNSTLLYYPRESGDYIIQR